MLTLESPSGLIVSIDVNNQNESVMLSEDQLIIYQTVLSSRRSQTCFMKCDDEIIDRSSVTDVLVTSQMIQSTTSIKRCHKDNEHELFCCWMSTAS